MLVGPLAIGDQLSLNLKVYGRKVHRHFTLFLLVRCLASEVIEFE